jgi:hypothetical protein
MGDTKLGKAVGPSWEEEEEGRGGESRGETGWERVVAGFIDVIIIVLEHAATSRSDPLTCWAGKA